MPKWHTLPGISAPIEKRFWPFCAVLRRFGGFLRREQSILRLSAIVRGFLRLSALTLFVFSAFPLAT